MRSASDDLTTRARIRDAAVLRFATDGFTAPVRTIAADAGISAALVIHHFGSKDALRAECDREVLAAIRRLKQEGIDEIAGGGTILTQMALAEDTAPLFGYVLRSVQDGSDVAHAFIDQMIEDAIVYTRAGVKAGLLRPSRDEAARARYLALSALGALLLEVNLNPPDDPADLGKLVRRFLVTTYPPMLELYSQGFFTTPRLLDEFLAHPITLESDSDV